MANRFGQVGSEVDFKLNAVRIPTQAGSYVVDLYWTHVRNMKGYNVYRAESRSDDPNDWYQINNKLIQVNYYQDRGFAGGIPVKQGRIAWWYKIIPVNLSDEEFPLSRSVSATEEIPLNGKQRWIAPTIRMRTNLLLDPDSFSSAELVHFFVRKWAGEYCSCIDVRTRKVNGNCAFCFGTGYAGGFELIENVYCRVRSAPKRTVADSPGITVAHDRTGIVGTYPSLTGGDFIVRMHNERYFIRDPKPRETQHFITAHAFTLERMQLYDMAYRIPAPPIIQPVARVSGGNVLGGVLARPEGASTNSARGRSAVRDGHKNVLGGETELADTTRTGVGAGRDYVGEGRDYPDV